MMSDSKKILGILSLRGKSNAKEAINCFTWIFWLYGETVTSM